MKPSGNNQTNKRPSLEDTALNENNSKRPRLAPPRRWADFIQNQDAVLGLTKYAHALLHSIRERDGLKARLENIPGAIDLVYDAVCQFIGEVWKVCVELSRIRIDVAIHEVLRDQIQEDLDPMYFLESFNVFDEQERAKLSSSGTGGGEAGAARQPEDSDVNRSPAGRKKKKRGGASDVGAESTVAAEATTQSPALTAMPQQSALLFGNAQIGSQSMPAATPEEKAREASLVQRKQAELSRQVELEDVTTALALMAGNDYVIPCPPRFRRNFANLCCMFYEPFMERAAAMRAQGIQVPLPGHASMQQHAQLQQQQMGTAPMRPPPSMLPPHLQQAPRRPPPQQGSI